MKPSASSSHTVSPVASTETSPSFPALHMRIRVLMAEQEIRSVSALQRKLVQIGVDISVAQLSRIVNNDSDLLNRKVLNGLMQIFGCGPDKLFTLSSSY